jgi:hypothetical protein
MNLNHKILLVIFVGHYAATTNFNVEEYINMVSPECMKRGLKRI